MFLELLRRKLYFNSDIALYYWKDYMGREIDFIIKNRDSITQLIQVTYASDKNEIDPREIEPFRVGASELKCDNMLVIAWDYEGTTLVNDKPILFTPLWKWLLNLSE